jgi:hypothetical protein
MKSCACRSGIFADFTNAQVDELLAGAGAGAQALLERLTLQLRQLHTDLVHWVEQTVSDLDDMDLDFLAVGDEGAVGMTPQQVAAHNAEMLEHVIDYERETRIELANELMLIWQKCPPEASRVMSDGALAGYRLDLAFEDYHRCR